jgi:uncharacterized repeat protein (TIGR01451 family)
MRNKLIFITILAFFVFIFTNSAFAATINVNPGQGTLSSAVSSAINGDTLNLATGTYTESASITVNKNLTISGSGEDNTIIDGQDKHQIFDISQGYTVTIENLCIQDGKSSGTGGAINNKGTLILNSCEIAYNNASNGANAGGGNADPGSDGGAIYNSGNLTVINCYIHDNNAGKGGDANGQMTDKGDSNHGGSGGAIYNTGVLNIQSSDFEYNHAGDGGNGSGDHDASYGGSGGAIYNAANATLSIDDTQFYHNYAGDGGIYDKGSRGGDGGNGGAIYNDENTGTVLITNSTIDSNYAGTGGGPDGSGGNGGAIYNRGVITVQNCEIDNNHAGDGGDASNYRQAANGGSGGAIYNEANDKDYDVILTVDNCEFSDNGTGNGGSATAGYQGGAGGAGGAIYNAATLTVKNGSQFEDNFTGKGSDNNHGAQGADGGAGGAIYTTDSATISDSTFDGNYTGDGGNGSDTRDGRAGGNGGAIYNNGTLTITNTTLSNNKGGKGGSIGVQPLDILTGGQGGSGGAIYNSQNGNLTISDCTLTKNEGGVGGDSGDFTSTAGTGGDGGAIYNDGKLTINQGTVIDGNKSGIGGGVLQASEYQHNLPWGDGGSGGAIYNDDDGILTIDETIITNNRAAMAGLSRSAGDGGAIKNTGTLTITQSEIRGNMAGVDVLNAFAKHFAQKYDIEWILNIQIDYGKGNGIWSDTDKAVTVNFTSFEENGTTYINSSQKVIPYIDDVYLNSANSNLTNLQNNWWGTNNASNIAKKVKGNNIKSTYYTPYLKLTITATPNPIKRNQTSTVTASLITNSSGQNTQQIYHMTVPDSVKVTFRVLNGSLSNKNTNFTSGNATAIFTPGKAGPGIVFARAGAQEVSTTINRAPVANVSLKMTATLTQYDALPDTIEYILTATNIGPRKATGLVITDLIPANTTLSTYYVWNQSTRKWDQLSSAYDPTTGIWNIGTLDILRTAKLKIDVTVNKTGITITNTAKRTAQNEDDDLRDSVTTKTKVP